MGGTPQHAHVSNCLRGPPGLLTVARPWPSLPPPLSPRSAALRGLRNALLRHSAPTLAPIRAAER
eukprot:4895279-Alexandrium_andersonii.AAC.1